MRPSMICDNSCLLQRVSTIPEKPSPRRCLYSEVDVELQILDTLQQLKLQPSFIHVKSHPDPTIPVEKLPWRSQLNVRCDTLATQKLKIISTEPIVPMLPASKVMLDVQGITITHHQASQIRRAYSKQRSKAYLSDKHEWTDEFDTIDWDLVNAKYVKMPFHKKLFITKWVNKLLPLNLRRYKRNLFPTAYCPSWCQQLENDEHLITCNHQTRQDHTKAFIVQLKRKMKQRHLDPY